VGSCRLGPGSADRATFRCRRGLGCAGRQGRRRDARRGPCRIGCTARTVRRRRIWSRSSG